MTFQEYINQEDPKRAACVYVTHADCHQITDMSHFPNVRAIIYLKIVDQIWRYILTDQDNLLRTMDEDGNPKSVSCFIYQGRLVGSCPKCKSDNTRDDFDFPDTMNNCNKCGCEWNIEGEITFDPTDDSDLCQCDECGKWLKADDEAYTDEANGKSLCDAHSKFNEATEMYQRVKKQL